MKFIKFSIVSLIFLFLFISLFSITKYNSLLKTEFNLDTTYTLKPNSNPHKLLTFFENIKVIDDFYDKIFYKVFLKNNKFKLLSGSYKLKGSYTIESLLLSLSKGGNVFVTITIPEGYRSEEISALIANNFKIDSLSFIEEILSENAKKKYGLWGNGNLRGFLMPETYQFYPNATIETIIKKITKEFLSFYNKEAKKKSVKYNNYDILKMASIVEKEAVVDKERALIAGVFYKRLKKNMLLQTDPTVRFASNNFHKHILRSQLRLDNPYNTYIYKGLPPTPICNPGKKSIQAALNPKKTEKLFFVAKFNGSGEHYFAKTNSEHNRNVKNSRANLRSK